MAHLEIIANLKILFQMDPKAMLMSLQQGMVAVNVTNYVSLALAGSTTVAVVLIIVLFCHEFQSCQGCLKAKPKDSPAAMEMGQLGQPGMAAGLNPQAQMGNYPIMQLPMVNTVPAQVHNIAPAAAPVAVPVAAPRQ